jgi:hypothetical protein
MKKLTLDLDKLAVDSFEADAATAGVRGTVLGAGTTDGDSYVNYCVPKPFTEGCGNY